MNLILLKVFYYYFKSLKSFWDFSFFISAIISIILGLTIYFFETSFDQEFYFAFASVCGILGAFSLSGLIHLSSSDNKTIRKAKTEKSSDVAVEGYKLTAFRRIFISACTSTILAFIILLFCVIGMLLPVRVMFNPLYGAIHDSLFAFFLVYMCCLNVGLAGKLFILFFNSTRMKAKTPKYLNSPYSKSKDKEKKKKR